MSTVSRPACRVVLGMPCQKAVCAVSRKPCRTCRPCRQSSRTAQLGNQKCYHLGGSGVDCSRMASTMSGVSAFKAMSAVSCDCFSRVSYARFGRVADEHWSFVSCLNIATGSGSCRVRPRHSCKRGRHRGPSPSSRQSRALVCRPPQQSDRASDRFRQTPPPSPEVRVRVCASQLQVALLQFFSISISINIA